MRKAWNSLFHKLCRVGDKTVGLNMIWAMFVGLFELKSIVDALYTGLSGDAEFLKFLYRPQSVHS